MKQEERGTSSAGGTVKGFTLVEMIVVLAIIVILAGASSLVINGFVRDSKIESLNTNAKLVYEAIQDMLIDCEVNDSKAIFNGRDESTDSVKGAVIYFRISEMDINGHPNVNGNTGLGDEIHVQCVHADTSECTNAFYTSSTCAICSRSFWKPDSTNPDYTSGPSNSFPDTDPLCAKYGPHGGDVWLKLNDYISRDIDKSMAGTYCVMIDLENYQILSVICRDLVDGRDPKTGLFNGSEVNDNTGHQIGYDLSTAIEMYDEGDTLIRTDGSSFVLPERVFIIKDIAEQKKIQKNTGVYVGTYPLGDTMYQYDGNRIL